MNRNPRNLRMKKLNRKLQKNAIQTEPSNSNMGEQPRLGVHSMPAELYHKAAGISKSMLDILAEKTPAHLVAYKEEPPAQTDAMRFGTIVHRALLEPDTYTGSFHTRPKDLKFTTKEGIAWMEAHQDMPILSDSEAVVIAKMVSA